MAAKPEIGGEMPPHPVRRPDLRKPFVWAELKSRGIVPTIGRLDLAYEEVTPPAFPSTTNDSEDSSPMIAETDLKEGEEVDLKEIFPEKAVVLIPGYRRSLVSLSTATVMITARDMT